MPNANPQPHPFGLNRQSVLELDARGRVIIPPHDSIRAHGPARHMSEADLASIFREVMRQRAWWRVRMIVQFGLPALFFFWSLVLMPLIALRAWPFR